jgi:hypothetical protein
MARRRRSRAPAARLIVPIPVDVAVTPQFRSSRPRADGPHAKIVDNGSVQDLSASPEHVAGESESGDDVPRR